MLLKIKRRKFGFSGPEEGVVFDEMENAQVLLACLLE